MFMLSQAGRNGCLRSWIGSASVRDWGRGGEQPWRWNCHTLKVFWASLSYRVYVLMVIWLPPSRLFIVIWRSSEPDFSFSLPCPSCPVCRTAMAPPTVILQVLTLWKLHPVMVLSQCTNGHLVCEPCHAKLHVTTCRYKCVSFCWCC